MDVLFGGGAGLVTGVIGSLVAAVAQLAAKRARNARDARRGDPVLGDVVFAPMWLLFGLVGLVAGLCWSWQVGGGWVTGAIAGAGLPALATVVFLIRAAVRRQAR